MKRIGFAVAIITVALFCWVLTPSRAQQPAGPAGNASPAGRYRLTVNELGMYCIDSATGQIWFKERGVNKWDDEGNPAIAKDAPFPTRSRH